MCTHSLTTLNLYLSCILALLEESAEVDLFSSLKNLFEKNWAFRRSLALMAVGFGVGMVYYDMPFGGRELWIQYVP
ncbi:unnamed protein product [Prunus armeniaca]|uniref:Major facilitator superfamily (MFS) profile domain-containing protein n=1 Tax=Prunus armeniaca TaxID=36596 RepID=A0A6J5X5N5_PRUAR|nr:unnamed protein product [Prunus armeniaca]